MKEEMLFGKWMQQSYQNLERQAMDVQMLRQDNMGLPS